MNALPDLPAGLHDTDTLLVDRSLTVPALAAAFPAFHHMPPVFATAYLVAFIEATCSAALEPYLRPDERTVGTHIDVSHCAATPAGVQVNARIELVAVEGRRLEFCIECRDESEVISRGRHTRVIVDAPRFTARVQRKNHP